MLADVGSDELAMVASAIGQDVLDEVVAELVTSDCDSVSRLLEPGRVNPLTINQGHTWAIRATLADAFQVALKEIVATNLEALLDDLGSILVHAVLGGEAKNMVDGAVTIGGSSVLADVLDAPVAKLSVRDDINTSQHLTDARAL